MLFVIAHKSATTSNKHNSEKILELKKKNRLTEKTMRG